MIYEIRDSYGAPQCKYESVQFATWLDLEEYIYDTDGLADRLADGYAVIVEL